MTTEMLPPHNNQAEESVIGSLLTGGLISHLDLESSDFYTDAMSIMYQACLNLYSRDSAIDSVTLADELSRQGKLKIVGGTAILSRLIADCPTSLDIEHYAKIVKRLSQFRKLIKVGQQITSMGFVSQDDFDINLEKADAFLLDLRKESTDISLLSPEDRASKQMERYLQLNKENKTKAVSTGLMDLDVELGGGLYPGDFIILGARPGMGKTTFIQQIANFIGSKNNVLFASGEMNDDAITDRDMATALSVPISTIRYGEYDDNLFDKLLDCVEKLKDRKVYIYESNRRNQFTLNNIYRVANEILLRKGLSLIIVDYLGLLKDKYGSNPVERLGYISQGLKSMAMELNVPILCAHQLNRSVEMREDKTPQLFDLRDSGNLEQDADIVLFLYRDNYYGGSSKITNAIIAKQRQGEMSDKRQVELFFDTSDHLYKNLARRKE